MKTCSSGRSGLSILLVAGMAAVPAFAGSAEERGAALLQPFKQQLMEALSSGLEQSPGVAIETCQVEAPAIAASLSGDGIEMGRTSHRLRNPNNEGPAWASAVLQDYLQMDTAPGPKSVTLEDGRTGYIEPILTQPLCLACHGSELSPAVQAALDSNYPDDKAIGFEAGELRGIFWVSFPSMVSQP